MKWWVLRQENYFCTTLLCVFMRFHVFVRSILSEHVICGWFDADGDMDDSELFNAFWSPPWRSPETFNSTPDPFRVVIWR